MILTIKDVALPDSIDQLMIRMEPGSEVVYRNVLVSCEINTYEQKNLEIGKWPIFRRTGLPSKFMKPHPALEPYDLPKLFLPKEKERFLSIHIDAKGIESWKNWHVTLNASNPKNDFPMIWYFNLGEMHV